MTWETLEEKYGVKFKTEDRNFRTIDSWLEDLYIQAPSVFEELTEEIFLNGDELFHKTSE
jgi:hypothetical protein